ncbi:hypothetical protein LPJ66_002877 [Kickxella alabastrina]|uniref:Uncharacterized protein n=1 Tax=Kickxella alabastrina TaxID=61397 RepID=A0ACC1IP92_9FUNG|nr:hypothetical protein LPJ66_002877 [Kickxella alabastrina]
MNNTAKILFEVIGDSPVQSAEDLVVALSQAVLANMGLQTATSSSDSHAWASPGLPQAHFSTRLTSSNDTNATTEVKWIAVGANVIMLVESPQQSTSSIDINTQRVVLPDAQFPLQAPSAEALASALEGRLTENAMATVAAAIGARIMPQNNCVPREQQQQERREDSGDYRKSGGEYQENQGFYNRPRVNVGGDDLNPLGPVFGGPMGIDGGNRGGGMVVGPDHPMFRQGGGRGPILPGSPETLPPGAVPPGARFDPIGPFGRMQGPGRGPGSGGNNFFSGEPNPDVGRPPDSSWNYYM